MANAHLNVDFKWEGDSLDRAFAELEKECEQIVRGLTVELWRGVLSKTPQMFGRMAASWTYSLNEPHYVDRSRQVPDPEGQKQSALAYSNFGEFKGLWRGHPVAIAIANAANAGKDAAFRLGDTVWFANGVDHGEGPYSEAVESGEIRLRKLNRPGQPVARTLDRAHSMYSEGVSAHGGARLKLLRLGV